MPNTESIQSRVMRKGYRLLVLLPLLLFVLMPAWGGDKAKDEETLKNATKLLNDMLGGTQVPADVLARANCIIVLPSVKKVGFGIGGSGGRGPMSCRGGKDFSGAWSAPAMYSISGASVGLQVGGSSTNYVLLVMSQKGVDAVLQGKTKLGNEATAAAGPSGATAGSVGADIYTYAKASGLFAGASLGGATLEPDRDANKRLYDKVLTAQQILLDNAATATPAGQELVSTLNTKVPKHRS